VSLPTGPELQTQLACNANQSQTLARPKVVNDWSTLTNWVPPVNEAQPRFGVTEGGVTAGIIWTSYRRSSRAIPWGRRQAFPVVESRVGSANIKCAVPLPEKAIIAEIRRMAKSITPSRKGTPPSTPVRVTTGMGDDCAVLRSQPGWDLLVTTDFTLEGIHFQRAWHPAEAVGHRCLTRGLSDIAAMGGHPVAAFLSLALPRDLPQTWVRGFMRGLSRLAGRHGVTLAGGDTAESPDGILADIIVLGSVPINKALLRSGAHAGDRICVSGELGGSAAAIAKLKSTPSGKLKAADYSRHFYPEPRVEVGRKLCEQQLASSMIDLSDGLSTDLAHICEESGTGAEIEAARIPRARVGRPSREVDLDLAFHGGEDYELLFTAPAGKRIPSHIDGVAITCIGSITQSRKMVFRDGNGTPHELTPKGWEHFRG